MNDNEWSELQRLWTSLPPQAEPVRTELERLRRWRGWTRAGIVVEALIALAGLGVATWLLIRAESVFVVIAGSATVVHVTVVCALSAWARLAPKPNPEDAVTKVLAVARRQALLGVRVAAATIWAIVAGMLFTAVMALARGLLTTEAALGGYIAIGAVQLMLAAWLAFAFWYHGKRSAALARLDAIAVDLQR